MEKSSCQIGDSPQPTVLVLLRPGDYGSRMLAGIREYANAVGWHLQTIEYSDDRKSRYRLTRTPMGDSVADLLGFWHPSGCIVLCAPPPTALQPEDFPGVPVVFLDRTPDTLPAGAVCVSCDASSIVRAASHELLQTGFPDFAYVPWPSADAWSRQRGEEFAKLVAMNGKRLHAFRYPSRRISLDKLAELLSPWIEALPKPCGVFAASDQIAEGILVACGMKGVSVPDEIAVVGVDDNEGICECTIPTLTSVRMDFEGGGRAAAEALAEMIAKGVRTVGNRVFGAVRLTRRASSRILPVPDAAVRKALEFIRLHACEGIGPRDVVKAMGISRTQADLRFRAAVRHTLLDEVHLVRLARAKELVARGIAPAAVADRCGYSSLADLQRVFRRRVGMTMRAWARNT
jgi:LacI family transcriptional regulator